MLVLVMTAPVVEVLHSHNEDEEHLMVVKTDQTSSYKKMRAQDQQTLDTLHVKCKICDHFAHHQPVSSFEVPTLDLIHFEDKVSTVTPVFDDSLLDLPGLSQTNKGPPAIA